MVKIKKASCKNFVSWEASEILIMFSFATYDSESHFLSFNNTIQENLIVLGTVSLKLDYRP